MNPICKMKKRKKKNKWLIFGTILNTKSVSFISSSYILIHSFYANQKRSRKNDTQNKIVQDQANGRQFFLLLVGTNEQKKKCANITHFSFLNFIY